MLLKNQWKLFPFFRNELSCTWILNPRKVSKKIPKIDFNHPLSKIRIIITKIIFPVPFSIYNIQQHKMVQKYEEKKICSIHKISRLVFFSAFFQLLFVVVSFDDGKFSTLFVYFCCLLFIFILFLFLTFLYVEYF